MSSEHQGYDSAARLREILDHMTEIVCRFLPDGTIIYVNEACSRLLERRPEELIGRSYGLLIHPEDLPLVHADVAALSLECPVRNVENRIVRPSGEIRWTQWCNRAVFDQNGELMEIQTTGCDITDKVQARHELERTHEILRFLAEASQALGSSLDYEETLGRVVRMVVPYLADMCLVSLLDEHGDFQRLAWAHVDPEQEAWMRAMEQEHRTRYQREHLTAGLRALSERICAGQPILIPRVSEAELASQGLTPEDFYEAERMRILSLLLVPLSARGRVLGVMMLCTSAACSGRIYQERELELARELASRAATAIDNARLYAELEQAHQRKDEFLATLAHELRNPMAAISSAMQILELPDAGSEVRARALSIAQRQLQHQARMVDDLLDVSRLTRGKISLRCEPVEVGAALRQVVEVHQPAFARKHQRLTLELPGGPLHVSADPVRLQQIVGNLLDNASKYTNMGGHVRLRAERAGNQVSIAVQDDGVGIAPEALSYIFEPFMQAPPADGGQKSGLGIGLTIARHLVVLHGGDITADSTGPGQGTTFVVRLPLLVHQQETGVQVMAQTQAPELQILVVDDNMDAADTLAHLLGLWGHQVRAVYSGQSALESARELEPHLVLIDIGMPEMDGYATAQRLREQGIRARLVALTGYAQPQDVERAHQAGFDRHVAKPVDAQVLSNILREISSS